MELMFEARTNLSGFSSRLHFVQHPPHVHSLPVLRPDTPSDGKGVNIFGSVLREGSRLRMWYNAYGVDWNGQDDCSATAYAESDDGLAWTKPALNRVPGVTAPNNLVNLGLGAATVFADPDDKSNHRYRAVGFGSRDTALCNPDITEPGYYTAHSPDGLGWHLDAPHPRWPGGDVSTAVYHPWQKRAIIALKHSPRLGRIRRRSIHTAEFKDGSYRDAVSALYPDDFDDVCALSRGHVSCDYYGMGLLPAGSGTVGFLWNFWHDLPYTHDSTNALYGVCDVTLVYQNEPGGRWLHMPGRPTFIDHAAWPWMNGGVYTASCPVDMGDEQWLFFGGQPTTHGFYLNDQWQRDDRWAQWADVHGSSQGGIGFARWPKFRLFGLEANPAGSFHIDLGPIEHPSELWLNYTTRPEGRIRVELPDVPGRDLGSSLPLTADSLARKVCWKDGSVIPVSAGRRISAAVHIELATLFAYELRAAPGIAGPNK